MYSLREDYQQKATKLPNLSRDTEPSGLASLHRERSIRTSRRQKFEECLLAQDVSIGRTSCSHDVFIYVDRVLTVAELRKLAWSGVPDDLRPIVWQLLLVSADFQTRQL
jgi:hypothetical protein